MRFNDEIRLIEDQPVGTWADFQQHAKASVERNQLVRLAIDRPLAGGGTERLEFEIAPRALALPPEYGFALRQAEYIYKIESIPAAMQPSFTKTCCNTGHRRPRLSP